MFAVIEPQGRKVTKFYRAKYKNIPFYWVKVWNKKPNWKRVYKRIGESPVVAPDFLNTPLKRVDTTAFLSEMGLHILKNFIKTLDKPQRIKRICIEDRKGEYSHLVIPFLPFAGEVVVATDNISKYQSLRRECINNYGAEVILQSRSEYSLDGFFSCDSLKLYFDKNEQKFAEKIKAPKGIDLPLGTELNFLAAMYYEGEKSFVKEIFAKSAKFPV